MFLYTNLYFDLNTDQNTKSRSNRPIYKQWVGVYPNIDKENFNYPNKKEGTVFYPNKITKGKITSPYCLVNSFFYTIFVLDF